MIHPDPPPQAPAIWASHVGRAAAAMPTSQSYVTQMPMPPSLRVAAVLDHFRRRSERMEHARKKLNAEELLRD
jgi:hypothetical protein